MTGVAALPPKQIQYVDCRDAPELSSGAFQLLD